MEYKLVVERKANFEKRVNNILENGWVPSGSPFRFVDEFGGANIAQSFLRCTESQPTLQRLTANEVLDELGVWVSMQTQLGTFSPFAYELQSKLRELRSKNEWR